MNKASKMVLAIAVILTVASFITWRVTGGDWYTKFEVVEQVKTNTDPTDPLVAAGFYEGSGATKTVRRKAFRFGLLPTPSGVFDKHLISVVSVVGPIWILAPAFVWFQGRRRKVR